MADSPLLSLEEASAYLRMHRTTLGQLANTGAIPSIQHTPGGRHWFTRELLDAYLVQKAAEQAAARQAAAESRTIRRPSAVSPWQESA